MFCIGIAFFEKYLGADYIGSRKFRYLVQIFLTMKISSRLIYSLYSVSNHYILPLNSFMTYIVEYVTLCDICDDTAFYGESGTNVKRKLKKRTCDPCSEKTMRFFVFMSLRRL